MRHIFEVFENFVDFQTHDLSVDEKANSFQLILALIKPFRLLIVLSALSGAFLTGLDLLKIAGTAYIIDSVINEPNSILHKNSIIMLVMTLIIYSFVDTLLWFINYMLRLQTLSSQSGLSALWQCHKSATKHDMSYFETANAGQISSRLNQIAGAVQSIVELAAGRFPIGLVRFLGSITIMFYLSAAFIVPILIWMLMNVVLAVYLTPIVNKKIQNIAENASLVNFAIVEYFSNIKIIKSNFAYCSENKKILEKIENENYSNLKINRLETLTGLYLRIANTLLLVSIFSIGIYRFSMSTISPGEFVAAITLVNGMTSDSGWFVAIWEGVTQSLGVIRDAKSTVQPSPKIFDKDKKYYPLLKNPPTINFDNVSFYHQPGLPILKNVTFEIAPYQKVGIVGPSGAGKSTLIDLMIRLYDVTSGCITLDGVDIRNLQLEQIRRCFSIIGQNDTLFHRSIYDNIAFNQPIASLSEVKAAAEQSAALSFIENMAIVEDQSTFDLNVGDRGARFSGGQRQRILFARALMQDRGVMLFDEATSALDMKTEELIHQTIHTRMNKKSIVLVTHKISSLVNFDQILVMKDGRIDAIGTHEELSQSNRLYQELY